MRPAMSDPNALALVPCLLVALVAVGMAAELWEWKDFNL